MPFKQILFFWMEPTTSSRGELKAGFTSDRKNGSKSTGTFAALKTSCTEKINSGPTPSPGMSVQVVLPSGFELRVDDEWMFLDDA